MSKATLISKKARWRERYLSIRSIAPKTWAKRRVIGDSIELNSLNPDWRGGIISIKLVNNLKGHISFNKLREEGEVRFVITVKTRAPEIGNHTQFAYEKPEVNPGDELSIEQH